LRRPLIILFLTVLLLMCGAPPLIGSAIEDRQQFLLDQLSRATIGAAPELEQYESGWFTSRARHRLPLDDARAQRLAHLLVGARGSPPSALVIDSVIAHGPWPLLEGAPSLARMRSVLLVVGADGARTPLPGQAATRIGFGGGGLTVFTAEPVAGPMADGQGAFKTAGAEIRVEFDRHADRLRSAGGIGPIEVAGANGLMRSGALEFESDTRPTRFGLRAGHSRVRLATFAFVDRLGREVNGDGLEIDLAVATDDEVVGYTARLELANMEAAGGAPVSARVEVALEALDGVMLGTLLQRIEQGFPLRGAGVELAHVVRPGSSLKLSELALDTGEGRATLSLDLNVPDDDYRPVSNAADLLSVIDGEGRLTLNPPMLNALLGVGAGGGAGDEDPVGLLSAGYLRRDGEQFVSELRISGGLITLNNQPLPLPFNR
jgi:hypothetical protein